MKAIDNTRGGYEKLKVEELNSGQALDTAGVWVALNLSDNLSNYDAICFQMFSGTRETASIISPYRLFNIPGREILLTDVSDPGSAITGILVAYDSDLTVKGYLAAGTARYIRIVGIKWS